MGGEDMGMKYLAELMKQLQIDMNSRFDRLDDRYDSVTDRLSEIDKTYVKRDELQSSMKQMLDDFSRLTGKIEGIFTALAEIRPVVDDIVPRVEQEAKWKALELRITTMEKRKENKNTFRSGVIIAGVSGIVGSGLSILGNYFMHK